MAEEGEKIYFHFFPPFRSGGVAVPVIIFVSFLFSPFFIAIPSRFALPYEESSFIL